MALRVKRRYILLLYLLVPVCLFGWINLQVSYKYEVDHQYFFVEMNDALTTAEKMEVYRELDKKGTAIIWQSRFILVLAAASFIVATILGFRKLK